MRILVCREYFCDTSCISVSNRHERTLPGMRCFHYRVSLQNIETDYCSRLVFVWPRFIFVGFWRYFHAPAFRLRLYVLPQVRFSICTWNHFHTLNYVERKMQFAMIFFICDDSHRYFFHRTIWSKSIYLSWVEWILNLRIGDLRTYRIPDL